VKHILVIARSFTEFREYRQDKCSYGGSNDDYQYVGSATDLSLFARKSSTVTVLKNGESHPHYAAIMERVNKLGLKVTKR